MSLSDMNKYILKHNEKYCRNYNRVRFAQLERQWHSSPYEIMGVPMSKAEYQVIRPYIVKEIRHDMHPTAYTVKDYLHVYHCAEGLTETFHSFAVSPVEKQRLTFVITNERQAGWKPTKSDIKELIESGRHPSPEEKAVMAEFVRI